MIACSVKDTVMEWICAGLNKDKYAVLVSSNDSVCFCPLCQISHLEDVVTCPRKRAG